MVVPVFEYSAQWYDYRVSYTCRLFSSTSILFPRTTKGKFSGSWGLAWMRNSSLQLSSVSKLFELLTS